MRLIDADAIKVDYIVPSTSTGTISTQYVSLCQILNAPTIEPQRMRGKWIKGINIPNRKPYFHLADALYCSECHEEAYWDTDYGQQLFDFCPNCGAWMGRQDE